MARTTALVTGIAGFVGAGLARELLTQDYDVHGIVRKSTDLWRLEEIQKCVTLHTADLADAGSVESVLMHIRPQTIFHLASHGTYPSHKNANEIHRGTVVAAENLFRAAKRAGVEIVLNAGTSSEYGNKQYPMCENDALEPTTPYGKEKAAQTLLSQKFAKEEKLPIITLRLFSVFGPFEDPGRLFPNVIKHALKNEDIPIADPSIARDFMYLTDAAHGFIEASKHPELSGEVINLSTGVQRTLKDVYDAVVAATGSGSHMATGAYAKRSYDTNMWVADVTKMTELLKFKPQYSLAQGVQDMVKWFPSYAHIYERE